MAHIPARTTAEVELLPKVFIQLMVDDLLGRKAWTYSLGVTCRNSIKFFRLSDVRLIGFIHGDEIAFEPIPEVLNT